MFREIRVVLETLLGVQAEVLVHLVLMEVVLERTIMTAEVLHKLIEVVAVVAVEFLQELAALVELILVNIPLVMVKVELEAVVAVLCLPMVALGLVLVALGVLVQVLVPLEADLLERAVVAVGGHQAEMVMAVILAHLVVKPLTLMVNQLLGQAVTQQEFMGAYRDIFNYTTHYRKTI
jgi:hypothetical protein